MKVKDFEHIYPHMLRYTFAARGLKNGIPPKVMQELLRHTSKTMTLDIYSHVISNMKAEKIKKIGNLFV
ncbi:tyrosine-type recombinase/integrase [Blautia marasmi]|nr:tyrosine-type recombinase/integrase [Blautia marasmi]